MLLHTLEGLCVSEARPVQISHLAMHESKSYVFELPRTTSLNSQLPTTDTQPAKILAPIRCTPDPCAQSRLCASPRELRQRNNTREQISRPAIRTTCLRTSTRPCSHRFTPNSVADSVRRIDRGDCRTFAEEVNEREDWLPPVCGCAAAKSVAEIACPAARWCVHGAGVGIIWGINAKELRGVEKVVHEGKAVGRDGSGGLSGDGRGTFGRAGEVVGSGGLEWVLEEKGELVHEVGGRRVERGGVEGCDKGDETGVSSYHLLEGRPGLWWCGD